MKKIILIGDSIRMGYAPFVQRELENEAVLWAPEENGGTSRNVLAHLDEWILSREADVVHLNCGLHDLARDVGAAGVRVEIDEYKRNVREILSRTQAGGKKIVWATITPVDQENHRTVKKMERWESDIERYIQAASGVASELQIPINDLNRVVNEAGKENLLLPDGVHFTTDGSKLLGKTVAAFLREQF